MKIYNENNINNLNIKCNNYVYVITVQKKDYFTDFYDLEIYC